MIQARVCEQRFILRLLRDNLIVKGLIERRIDLGENVAFLHILALGVGNFDEAAANLGANDCGIEGLHRADAVQIDRHVGGRHLCGDYGNDLVSAPVAMASAALTASRGCFGGIRGRCREELIFVDESNQPAGNQYKNQVGY